MSAALSMHEALFGGRNIGAGAVPNPQVVQPSNGTFYTTPAPVGYGVQIILPVNKSGLGFTPVQVSFPSFVTTENNVQTVQPGHAQAQDNLPGRGDPSKGIFWFWTDGKQSFVKFTWQDMISGQYGGGNNYNATGPGPVQVATVMIAAAPPAPPGKVGFNPGKIVPFKPPPNLKPLAYGQQAATSGAFAPGATQAAIQAGLSATQAFQATAVAAGAPSLPPLVGGVSTGGTPFPLTQGQRISVMIKSNSGALPGGFGSPSAPLTNAQLQAQLDAAGIQSTVRSVNYSADGTTLFVEEDHCGPTTSTSNPFVAPDGSVTTSYQDLAGGQCGAVQPAGWSKTKKAVVFGGGAVVLAVVVAGGTKAAGLW